MTQKKKKLHPFFDSPLVWIKFSELRKDVNVLWAWHFCVIPLLPVMIPILVLLIIIFDVNLQNRFIYRIEDVSFTLLWRIFYKVPRTKIREELGYSDGDKSPKLPDSI